MPSSPYFGKRIQIDQCYDKERMNAHSTHKKIDRNRSPDPPPRYYFAMNFIFRMNQINVNLTEYLTNDYFNPFVSKDTIKVNLPYCFAATY